MDESLDVVQFHRYISTCSPYFFRFCDIKSFAHLAASVEACQTKGMFPPIDLVMNEALIYQGKVKLHGANAGVRIENQRLRVQSRNQLLGTGSHGTLIYPHKAYFLSLFDPSIGYEGFTIYGEWAGPGVQKGVALSHLKNNIFVIYCIQFDDNILVEPTEIEKFLTKSGTVSLPPLIYILPWHTPKYTIDFRNLESVQKVLDEIDNEVNKIDSEDPWVLNQFGVKGAGEGLVLYPVSLGKEKILNISESMITREHAGCFLFKAKGEKHRVTTAKKSVQITPESASSALAYYHLMCPEPRLNQGVSEIGGFDQKKIGKFIQWIIADVKKEGQPELERSGLTWAQVGNTVSDEARKWYLAKLAESSK